MIAGELPGGELVERQIFVKCLNDPVAVWPHGSFVIEVKAVCVSISGDIEPSPGHVFTILR